MQEAEGIGGGGGTERAGVQACGRTALTQSCCPHPGPEPIGMTVVLSYLEHWGQAC